MRTAVVGGTPSVIVGAARERRGARKRARRRDAGEEEPSPHGPDTLARWTSAFGSSCARSHGAPASTSSTASATRCSTSARRRGCGPACAATSTGWRHARRHRAHGRAGAAHGGDRDPQSEAEALHLEQNLVKRHRPPYNVRLRDDKSFPYIAVTVSDEYPRVMFTRERHRRGHRLLRPVREREEGARDARRAQPRLPVPAVRGPEAGPPLGHPVPRLPHRAVHGAVHPRHLDARTTGR